jgi:hypothetical protein
MYGNAQWGLSGEPPRGAWVGQVVGGQTNHKYIHLPHATPNGQFDPLLLCRLVWASENGVRVLWVIVITKHKPRAWLRCIDFKGAPYMYFLKCWFLDMQTNMHISLDKCARSFETWMSWLLNELVRFKYCIKLWALSRFSSPKLRPPYMPIVSVVCKLVLGV